MLIRPCGESTNEGHRDLNNQSRSRLFTVTDGSLVTGVEQTGACGRHYWQPGSIIDKKYEVLRLLGEGGMGAVYRVRHLMLNKDMALKTFRQASLTREICLRFQREAQAIARLDHRCIIQIFDFGMSEDGVPYYTMEYLKGQSLADKIEARGPLGVAEAVRLFGQICQGLAVAHSKGIIHRDLKPANIFLTTGSNPEGVEEVKIVDFGIAGLADSAVEDQRLTAAGVVFGSPLYMSPEQSSGQRVTERADIYSLGCTLFEALAGVPPYRGATAMETIMMHHISRLPNLREASGGRSFPGALERTVARMLERSPEARQPDMEQVAAELFQCSQNRGLDVHRAMWSVRELGNASCYEEQNQPASSGNVAQVLKMLVVAVVLIGIASISAIFYLSRKGQLSQTSSCKNSISEDRKSVPVDNVVGELQKANRGRSVTDKVLTIEKLIGESADDPYVLMRQGRIAEVQALLNRRVETRTKALGPNSREVAESIEQFASSYMLLHRYVEAERLYKQALSIYEKARVPNDQQLARTLVFLGVCYREQGRLIEAESLTKRALLIDENALGPNDLVVADIVANLAICYLKQGKSAQAETMYKRSLAIYNKAQLGPNDLAKANDVKSWLRQLLSAKSRHFKRQSIE